VDDSALEAGRPVIDSADFWAMTGDSVFETIGDSLVLASAPSDVNFSSDKVPSTTDLDSECCVNDRPEPDAADWDLTLFWDADAVLEADLRDTNEVLDCVLWDCGADDARDADSPGGCVERWLTELCPENVDTVDAGLSVTASVFFGKPSATS